MVAFVWTPFHSLLRIVEGTRKARMKRSCPMEPWGVVGEQPRSGAMGEGGGREDEETDGEISRERRGRRAARNIGRATD
jgi:hypothetical protein